MNMKKNNKGFSLVELIVVIAIMAILAAVAVVGVSVYVPKAQKAADAELVNDIIYAVTLRDYETQFASKSNGVVGYVIVTKDGNVTVGGDERTEIEEALVATFGANYAQELRLSYDGWTDAKIMLEQVSDPEIAPYIGSVNESTYITDIGTDKLLSDVQLCASSFGTFLDALHGGDKIAATNSLINGFADQNTVKEMLSDAGYSEDNYNKVSKEVLQNVTVFAVASEVKKNPNNAVVEGFQYGTILEDDVDYSDNLDEIANWYAAAEALVKYLDDTRCSEAFASIRLDSGDALVIARDMNGVRDFIYDLRDNGTAPEDDRLRANLEEYYAPVAEGKNQAQKDGEAYFAIMSSVNNLSGEYLTDKESIENKNLFDGGGLNNRVDTYIAAASLAGNTAKITELKNHLSDGDSAVVILVCASNGVLDFMLLPAGVLN